MAKRNGYPETVRPGIPKLAATPAGWERTSLGKHLAEVRRPVRMDDDAEYRLVTVKRARGGLVERERLKGREIQVKSQFRVHTGDFVISKRQIVHGACGLVPASLDGCIVSNEYAVLKALEGFSLPYLRHLSESVYFQQTCFHSSIGVHVEKMIFKLGEWLHWPFNIPPLAEQKRVVEVLSSWDRAIEAVENLIKNTKTQKRALMQRLFPHDNRENILRTRYDRLRLREVADVNSHSLGNDTRGDFRFRYISLSDVQSGRILDQLETHIFDQSPSRARRRIKVGDILMSTVRPNLQAFARVDDTHSRCIASTGFAVLTAKPDFDADYLYHYLFSAHVTGQLNALVVGSNYPAVNASDVEALLIYCPPLCDQRKISRMLNALDLSLLKLSRRRDQLSTEKMALIQQLLTGKKRMKTAGETTPVSATG